MKLCNACGQMKPAKAFTGKEWVCKTCRNQRRTRQAREQKYGITFEEFSAMLDAQEGKCAICETEFEGEPMVDHDHVTRRVRGLLCKHCNTGLGMFHDDVQRLSAAARYLQGEENG
jgi:hypothetical protein